MKLSNVVASPSSGVYKPTLEVKLECPDVRVEQTPIQAPLLTTCASLNIAKVSDILYFNFRDNSVGLYNIKTNELTSVPFFYDTDGASFVNVGDYIYIMGGAAIRRDIYKHEIGSSTVFMVYAKLSQPLRSIPCVAIGKYIYMIGGESNTTNVTLIQRYDTELDTIETMSYSLIYGVSAAGVAEYNGKIYVIGSGWNSNNVQVIDTVLGTVSTITSLPVRIYYGGASVVGDYLYSFGKYVGESVNRIFKKYLLDDSDWVEEPYRLAQSRYEFGYCTDEEGYYHIIGGTPKSNGRYYEAGRFGLPSSDVDIRYTQTDDGTIPSDPTITDTLYTTPIELTTPTKHKIKAKAFYVGL